MGFVLLLGLCAYILLARLVIRLLMRIPKEAPNKRIVMYLGIFTAILIPYWDIPLIDWKFNQLCKTEAGIHVYEEVALGPEDWEKVGTLKSTPSRQLKLEDAIPDEFEVVHDWGGGYSSITSIRKTRWQIRRKKDQKIIGEVVYIWHGRNWLGRWLGLDGGGGFCLDLPYTRIAEAVFKQKYK